MLLTKVRAKFNKHPLFVYPLKSWLRLILLKIRGREYIVYGKCNGCGKCCSHIQLKYEKGWISTTSQFDELCKAQPEYRRFVIVDQRGDSLLNFTCTWYSNRSGCREYEKRLEICKKYPSKSLLLHGGKMIEGCGFRLQSVKPFKSYLNREIKKLE